MTDSFNHASDDGGTGPTGVPEEVALRWRRVRDRWSERERFWADEYRLLSEPAPSGNTHQTQLMSAIGRAIEAVHPEVLAVVGSGVCPTKTDLSSSLLDFPFLQELVLADRYDLVLTKAKLDADRVFGRRFPVRTERYDLTDGLAAEIASSLAATRDVSHVLPSLQEILDRTEITGNVSFAEKLGCGDRSLVVLSMVLAATLFFEFQKFLAQSDDSSCAPYLRELRAWYKRYNGLILLRAVHKAITHIHSGGAALLVTDHQWVFPDRCEPQFDPPFEELIQTIDPSILDEAGCHSWTWDESRAHGHHVSAILLRRR